MEDLDTSDEDDAGSNASYIMVKEFFDGELEYDGSSEEEPDSSDDDIGPASSAWKKLASESCNLNMMPFAVASPGIQVSGDRIPF